MFSIGDDNGETFDAIEKVNTQEIVCEPRLAAGKDDSSLFTLRLGHDYANRTPDNFCPLTQQLAWLC